MCKFLLLFILFTIMLIQAEYTHAEDYSEGRQRCESAYIDCTNKAAAPDPEVQEAKLGFCKSTLLSCNAECEHLRPVESPTGTENNPNIIRK